MHVNVELAKTSIKLYCSQMCINYSRNVVYSLRLKSYLKRCSFCWTTHFRRRRHSLILRSMNFWDSAHLSSTIACFSCSTVSNSNCSALAAAGLHTLHNLPGSSLDCLLATSQTRWLFALQVADGVWQWEMACHTTAEVHLNLFQLCPHS